MVWTSVCACLCMYICECVCVCVHKCVYMCLHVLGRMRRQSNSCAKVGGAFRIGMISRRGAGDGGRGG